MAKPLTASSGVSPASLKKDVRAMLTACKDVTRTIENYVATTQPEATGVKLAEMQLELFVARASKLLLDIKGLSK